MKRIDRLKKFREDFAKWRPGKKKSFNMNNWSIKTDCGTAMCAAGYCSTLKWAQEEGFGLTSSIPEYKDYIGYQAVERFFGISEADAEYLFCPYHYPEGRIRRIHVLTRLDEVIAKKDKKIGT